MCSGICRHIYDIHFELRLTRLRFDSKTLCIPCTRFKYRGIWRNGEMCLMIYRVNQVFQCDMQGWIKASDNSHEHNSFQGFLRFYRHFILALVLLRVVTKTELLLDCIRSNINCGVLLIYKGSLYREYCMKACH